MRANKTLARIVASLRVPAVDTLNQFDHFDPPLVIPDHEAIAQMAAGRLLERHYHLSDGFETHLNNQSVETASTERTVTLLSGQIKFALRSWFVSRGGKQQKLAGYVGREVAEDFQI
jgi:hypothetical protein